MNVLVILMYCVVFREEVCAKAKFLYKENNWKSAPRLFRLFNPNIFSGKADMIRLWPSVLNCLFLSRLQTKHRPHGLSKFEDDQRLLWPSVYLQRDLFNKSFIDNLVQLTSSAISNTCLDIFWRRRCAHNGKMSTLIFLVKDNAFLSTILIIMSRHCFCQQEWLKFVFKKIFSINIR